MAFDPEGSGPDTHYKALQAVAEALRMYEKESGDANIRVWGYRNVWYRFRPSEADLMVPVSLNSLSLLHTAFMNCFGSQSAASFPSYEHDGPFSELAQQIQVEQYDMMKTCLGHEFLPEARASAHARCTRHDLPEGDGAGGVLREGPRTEETDRSEGMNMRRMMMVLLAGLSATASGQVRITSTEQLPLPADRVWTAPQFSPDGSTVFVTTAGYRGIWHFTPATRALRQICDDAGAGYGFSVSPDGGHVSYRRTLEGTPMNRRVQEIVEVELSSGEQVVRAAGRDLPTPVYVGDRVLYTPTGELKKAPAAMRAPAGSYVLGIEDTRIAAVINGSPVQLDPYHGGSYIWPSLSPDGTRLVAYEMSRGTFVSDLTGKILAEFGRRDAPAWMRSGRWIVYMDQKDDGHQMTSSDLYCISPDGKATVRLTNTTAIELMPVCSPADNRILVCTPGGEVYVLGYEEVAGR